jgi:cytochrome c-type biogenesis protein CcmF
VSEVGRLALLLALAASAWALVAGAVGAVRRWDRPTRSAEFAVTVSAFALSVAALSLFAVLLGRDFRVEYVAQYTSRSLSIFYTLSAFWAGQSGSLLLWAWVLAICASIVAARHRQSIRELMPWVTTILAGTLVFFLVLVVFYANPFRTLPVAPPDGQGLNPLLQNYGQWIHPITLYLGFVGLTVPFAFAISALITGHLGDEWILAVRKWTLWSWILLTAGILFGARWAYVELGWGGYWAWDPVENASLLPWLTATIYLHSAVAQEKRGIMKAWNVSMLAATFALCIFGTFLTRSGVVSSVHAFAESTMGPLLIAFTLLIAIGSAALIVWRLPLLRRERGYGSVVSRESSFLATGLLFTAMTVVVFWGTVYPLVAQAIHGTKVSVGTSFFQSFMVPLSILLLVLVGLCPQLAWRRTSKGHLWRQLAGPMGAGGIALALGLMLSRGSHLLLVGVETVAAFAFVSMLSELARGLRARHAVHREGWPTALRNMFALTPRRYAGPLVHAGFIILLTGIAVNLSLKQETKASLAIGGSTHVGGYTLTLTGIDQRQDGARFATVGTFAITGRGGAPVGTVTSQQVVFDNQQQVTEIGIRSSLGADLYVVMGDVDQARGLATVEAFVEPGVLWIWVGMTMVLLAAIIGALPRRPNMLVREPDSDRIDSVPAVNADLVRARVLQVEAEFASVDARDDLGEELEVLVEARKSAMRSQGCPGCGAGFEPGDRFCRSCGHGLEVPRDETRDETKVSQR